VRDNPDVPIGHVIAANVDPTLSPEEIAAYYAPYPDARYKVAMQTFPEMVPDSPSESEAVANLAAWSFLESFSRPFMTIFGRYDDPTRESARMSFVRRVPGARGRPQPQLDVTHYAPEDRPEEVAGVVADFLDEVYRDEPFEAASYSDLAVEEGPFVVSHACVREVGVGASTTSACELRPITFASASVVRVAFRYVVRSAAAGRLSIELERAGAWAPLAVLQQGVDFAVGAEDYAFVPLTETHTDLRVRLRMEGGEVLVRDFGVYARPPAP